MPDSKVIVITGASSGIGAALATHLGQQGHRLALAARRQAALEAVASAIGERAVAIVTDVTRRGEVERLRDETLRAFERIDVWVNNAGRGINRAVIDLTDAEFDEMMLVNTKSALYGMQAIVPYFTRRGEGHLINISSFLGRVPLGTYRSAYSAAKAALNVLTANLRMDLGRTHPRIHVSLVMPAMVFTEFQKNALGGTPPIPPSAMAVKPQTVDEAAAAIAELIAHPVAELYTNPASPEILRRYHDDVGAFERGLGRPG